jgi:hypothetical protein
MEKIKNQEWKNQTVELGKKVAKFIVDFYAGKFEAKRYDPISDLHFSGSGGDSGIMEEIKQGKAPLISVNTFMENGRPTQIHAIFGTNNGNNVDIYFKGKALEDLLKFEEK